MYDPPVPHAATSEATPLHQEVVAPADLAPVPSRRERFAWYAGSMALALVLVCAGLRLDQQDLSAPFYYDQDVLLYLPFVKTTIDHGSHWRNERVGAPGIQELYDFPVIDYLHFGILWFIGRFSSDVLLVYNLYNFLTYPLTVLTAMIVFRWLKLSLPAAAVAGLLYAFLPYHQERSQVHYFLAAYWVVPLSLMPALAIGKGNFPLFRKQADGTRRWHVFSQSAFGTLVLGALTASAGAYYAFFTCAIYAFAGLYAVIVFRTWRGAASAAWAIAPIVLVGIAFHYPTFVYQHHYGVNSITTRWPEEAEIYGLKLAHLLLPTVDHNLTVFSNLRTHYSTSSRPADGENAGALGGIGSMGLLALLAMAMFPRGRRWPEKPLVAFVLFILLLATVGGFGSIFNLLVTAQIRAYNRISVFLAFLCFFAVFWWIDRFLLTRTSRRGKQLRYPAYAALFLIGFLDQTPFSWFKERGTAVIQKHAERFRADKRFFQQIEEASPGAQIFCLPYAGYPECAPLEKMPAYEHSRGYFLSHSLTFSYGAVRGREADAWQREVCCARQDEFLRRIVARGFTGLTVDGRAFSPTRDVNRAAVIINEFDELYRGLTGQRAGRLPVITHEDGKQFFVDLRPYRDAYQAIDPHGFARQATFEREWVAPLWLKGFEVATVLGSCERIQRGAYNSTLVLVNPTDRTRTFDMSFTVGIEVAGTFGFELSGLKTDTFELEKIPGTGEAERKYQTVLKSYTGTNALELPPGRSILRFHCKPPPSFVPGDHRKQCFFVKDFTLVEK